MSKEPDPEGNESPLFKKIRQMFGLAHGPDTAEDLEQEIQELLEDGEEHGLISAQEGEMISSIFDFRETLTREIMTPRTEIVWAPASTPIAEIITLITDKGFTRIPVYSENQDHIVGIIHAKDLLRYCAQATAPLLAGELVNPAFFVPENQKIIDLLRNFKAKKMHMAIVTDEFGSVRGLITLEDVLEELVGEIDDEYDTPDTHWRVLGENTLITDAKVDIEEVEAFFKLELPEGPYESVGGLIIHQLGRVPAPGATARFEPLTFTVLTADPRRIHSVKIQKKI